MTQNLASETSTQQNGQETAKHSTQTNAQTSTYETNDGLNITHGPKKGLIRYVTKHNVIFWLGKWGYHLLSKEAYQKLKQDYKEIWHVFLTVTRDLNRQYRDSLKEEQNRTYMPVPFDEETQALIEKWTSDEFSVPQFFPHVQTIVDTNGEIVKDEHGQKERHMYEVPNMAQMSFEAVRVVEIFQLARQVFNDEQRDTMKESELYLALHDYLLKHSPQDLDILKAPF